MQTMQTRGGICQQGFRKTHETENTQQEPNQKAGATAAQHATSSAASTRTHEGKPTAK